MLIPEQFDQLTATDRYPRIHKNEQTGKTKHSE